MGGEINIKSEYRKGTKFTIFVIVEVINPNYVPETESQKNRKDEDMSLFE